MSDIVRRPIPINLSIHDPRQPPELNNWLIVQLRSRGPHNLHLILLMGQANMYLFGPRIVGDFYPRDIDELLESDLEVEIRIEEFEDRDDVFCGDMVLRLHTIEVIHKFLKSGNAIFVGIVSRLPEGQQVAHGYFGKGDLYTAEDK